MTIPFGILHQQWGLRADSDADLLRETLEDVVLAEELGFSSFLFGEHHFQSAAPFAGRVPVPELVIARAAAGTDRIRLGTGVKVLALDAAWRTAEAMLTLDLVTGGRAVFGLGAGGDEPDVFRGRRLGPNGHRALFRETLTELLDLLRTQGSSTFARPLGPAREGADLCERILVAARDVDTITLAGREGLGFVVGQAEVARTQAGYVDTFRATGCTGEVRAVRIVVVAADDERALEVARAPYDVYSSHFLTSRYYLSTVAPQFDGPLPRDYTDGLTRMAFVVGGPETVAARLEAERRTIGADRMDVLVHLPGLAARERRESMRLFATEVAPMAAALAA